MSRSGLAGLVAAALGWGSLAVSTMIALRGIGPLAPLLGEVTIASALLLTATLATGHRLPRLSWRLLALGALQPGVQDVHGTRAAEPGTGTRARFRRGR